MARVDGIVDERHGPIVEVQVCVPQQRKEALLRCKFPVPEPQRFHAVIDTGSSFTGFHPGVFAALDLHEPVEIVDFLTPSTLHHEPVKAGRHHVAVELRAVGGALIFSSALAFDAKGFHPDDPDRILGIIGRDIINLCDFEYLGPRMTYSLNVEL